MCTPISVHSLHRSSELSSLILRKGSKMSATSAVATTKFLRKTTLRETEFNKNFKMLDDDIAETITSASADEVTPLMSKVYTRLLLTPTSMRESGRVLRFAGEEREGKWVTAWEQLRGHLRVSSETARKALRWMHVQGIIGYYSGKNGVGIRIFLNRAASSVSKRREEKGQKILPFARASDCPPRTSAGEAPFNDSYAVSEVLDKDLNPRAPQDGADNASFVSSSSEQSKRPVSNPIPSSHQGEVFSARAGQGIELPLAHIVSRLKCELEPSLQRMARQAAANEHGRTREWLESRGLPKAARVAQRETYDVLRRHGVIREPSRDTHAEVGAGVYVPPEPHKLSQDEVLELAEACVSLLEAKGQSVEATLGQMNVAAGGFLLPEDSPRVLEQVETLLGTRQLMSVGD